MNWQKLVWNIVGVAGTTFFTSLSATGDLEQSLELTVTALFGLLTGLFQKPPQRPPDGVPPPPNSTYRPPLAALLVVLLLAGPASAANNLTANPWILDTAGGSLVAEGNIRVVCIKWTGATTTGHTAVLTDASDKVIWQDLAPGSNFTVSECLPLTFLGGVKLPTLGSGKVFLYVAP